MLTRSCLYIEAGADALRLVFVRKGAFGPPVVTRRYRAPLPEGAFGSAEQMAEAVALDGDTRLDKIETVVLVNAGGAALTVAGPDAAEGAFERTSRLFPIGDVFNETTHVMSCAEVSGTLFAAALPVELAECMVGMCRKLTIAARNIERVDLLEHALARYYGYLYPDENIWLCFTGGGSLRIVALSGGAARAAYCVSAEGDCRGDALKRLWYTQPLDYAPERAILCGAGGCDWPRGFFDALRVPVEERDADDGFYAFYTENILGGHSRLNGKEPLNLPPAWAGKQRRRRLVLTRISAVEAVIFFIVLSLILGVNLYAENLRARADTLEALLADSFYAAADETAALLKAAEAARDERIQLAAALPERFDYELLDAINGAAAEGVVITTMDINEAYIHLTAEAPDLRIIGVHRDALYDTGLFPWAAYGPAARRENGTYSYKLYLGVK